MIRAEIAPGCQLDSRMALYFAEIDALVVADVHWGYAIAHRAAGNLLPAWGDESISKRLRALLDDYQPATLILLGDSLHSLAGADEARTFLREIPKEVEVRVVSGNHDRRWEAAIHRTYTQGRFFFHHGDKVETLPEGSVEIIGHHHPAFSWSDGAGARIKFPALVFSPNKLILPAFSPWSAGTPWRISGEEKLWVASPKRVFEVGRQKFSQDLTHR